MTYATIQRLLVFGAALFAGGTILYLVVSYVLTSRHTPRPLRTILRSALREAFWVLVTQPLLPLYYRLGERMGGRAEGVPVVFVHGYMQNRVGFLRIARALGRAGSGPLHGFNYPFTGTVAASARRLGRFIERVRRQHGAARVDLVCHSLGGLVAMEFLASGGIDVVRRCVTVGSPHAGIQWRGPLLGPVASELRHDSAYFRERRASELVVPCLSIASTDDNVVYPATSSALAARGGKDLVLGELGHLSLLFAPQVAEAVVGFLCEDRVLAAPKLRAVQAHVEPVTAASAAATTDAQY